MVSVEQFFELIRTYNNTFWPLIWITYLLGFIVFYYSYNKTESSDKLISGFLALLWIWVGMIFWIGTFGPFPFSIFGLTFTGNWILLGIMFIIQGCLFIYYGIIKPSLSFRFEKKSHIYLGILFFLYSLLFYPLIGFLTGHPYPDYPIFGIAPCPVTIFTFGMVLWTDKRVNLLVIIIPFVYSLIGILPLMVYGVLADLGLIFGGIIGFSVIIIRDNKLKKE
ncbi:MAG: DUF6064 family protein [Candidatus Hodarchaeales archaeon]